MKRIIMFSIAILVVMLAFSQTQQGYVKTLGRPNKPGVRLSGVTVRVQGAHNAVLSNAQGVFSMQLVGKKQGDVYSLQQVQKQGYELNDNGVIGRRYAYSSTVPLSIVMVSSSQLQADKQRMEDNAYKVGEKNYKEKIALLEKQQKTNQITIDEYRQQIQDLQNRFEKYQSLIDGLADHYAHTDYDALDEKEQEINLCIENGDLNKAEQLLQQLDIEKRLADIEQRIKLGKRLMAEAEKDMARIQKQQEKDAEYLYHLYTISLARFDFSKAEFYIETRALLDTTNYKWQFAVAEYCQNQKKYEKAEKYYNRTIALGRPLLESGCIDGFVVKLSLNNLGVMYSDNQQYDRSEKSYLNSLYIANKLEKEYPSLFDDEIAMTKGNLATLYLRIHRLDECERLLKEILEIYRRLGKENPERYESSLAKTLNNYALLLHNKKQWYESISFFEEALQIYNRQNFGNLRKIEDEKASIMLNMGNAHKELGNESKSKECFEKAIFIYRELAIKEPQIYQIDMARALNNLANVYKREKNFIESEKLYLEAYHLYSELIKKIPHEVEPDYATTINNLGEIYYYLKKYHESEAFYKKALDIRRRLYAQNPNVYQFDLANNLLVIGGTIQMNGEIKRSIPYLEESIQLYRQIKSEKRFYIYALDLIGQLYCTLNNNVKAYEYYTELLPLIKKAYMENPIEWKEQYVTILGNMAFFSIFKMKYEESEYYARLGLKQNASENWINTTLAAALLFQGKYAEAETVYLKFRNQYKKEFLSDFKLYEESGVIPPKYKSDVEKIKNILNKQY